MLQYYRQLEHNTRLETGFTENFLELPRHEKTPLPLAGKWGFRWLLVFLEAKVEIYEDGTKGYHQT